MAVVTEITSVDGEDTSGSMVDKLVGMSDADLQAVLGWDTKMTQIKADIAEMAKLTGKAREEAEKEVTRMLTPSVDAHNIHWALEDAKRAAKKGGKEGMCDCSPTSVMD